MGYEGGKSVSGIVTGIVWNNSKEFKENMIGWWKSKIGGVG